MTPVWNGTRGSVALRAGAPGNPYLFIDYVPAKPAVVPQPVLPPQDLRSRILGLLEVGPKTFTGLMMSLGGKAQFNATMGAVKSLLASDAIVRLEHQSDVAKQVRGTDHEGDRRRRSRTVYARRGWSGEN